MLGNHLVLPNPVMNITTLPCIYSSRNTVRLCGAVGNGNSTLSASKKKSPQKSVSEPLKFFIKVFLIIWIGPTGG